MTEEFKFYDHSVDQIENCLPKGYRLHTYFADLDGPPEYAVLM